MRLRTIILFILVLVVSVVAFVLIRANANGTNFLDSLRPQPTAVAVSQDTAPAPTPTPAIKFESVLVAKADLPIGTRITADLVETRQRPADNIALQGEYTFSAVGTAVGQITRTNISAGQAILKPMLALNPNDISALGSDLALYVNEGEVALALPINKFSGAALAMRPGDTVDLLMTLAAVDIDPEFRSQLPNISTRVTESDLLDGRQFLFSPTTQGRLEFAEEVGIVAEIVPASFVSQIPKRATQLTIQQAGIVWVGTWKGGGDSNIVEDVEESLATGVEAAERTERTPDLVILSMSAQNALALKWALERGIDIDLALRAQGDDTVFDTASVSLPLFIQQGLLDIPESSSIDLAPRADSVPPPSIPDESPE